MASFINFDLSKFKYIFEKVNSLQKRKWKKNAWDKILNLDILF